MNSVKTNQHLDKIKKYLQTYSKSAIKKMRRQGIKIYIPVDKDIVLSPDITGMIRIEKSLFDSRILLTTNSLSYRLLNDREKHMKVGISLTEDDKLRLVIEYRTGKGNQHRDDFHLWSNLIEYRAIFIEDITSDNQVKNLSDFDQVIGEKLLPYVQKALEEGEDIISRTTSVAIAQSSSKKRSTNLFLENNKPL